MYIRLVPRRTDDTAVVYNIGFKSLPESLVPQRWLATHHQLRADGIAEPESIYALDAASAPVSILHQVEFDLRCRTITCTFFNGREEVWPIDTVRRDYQGRTCEEMLDSVSDDVRLPPADPTESDTPEPAAPSPSKGKHRRKSSLFMTLINSLTPSAFSSPTGHKTANQSSTARRTPEPVRVPPFPPSLAPRLLRRRARSTLVDAFRLHIIPRLNLPQGGYPVWALQNMLKSVGDDMEKMWPGPARHSSAEPTRSALDASPSFLSPRRSKVFSKAHSQSASTSDPSQPPTSMDYVMYNNLAMRAKRIRELLGDYNRAASQLASITTDHSSSWMRALEMRSRRRAWSAKALPSGSMDEKLLGLAEPLSSSPLRYGFVAGEEPEPSVFTVATSSSDSETEERTLAADEECEFGFAISVDETFVLDAQELSTQSNNKSPCPVVGLSDKMATLGFSSKMRPLVSDHRFPVDADNGRLEESWASAGIPVSIDVGESIASYA